MFAQFKPTRKGDFNAYIARSFRNKKGDKAQIARIVKELEEHIQLCNEADLDCTEYKHILEEYKNIK